MTTDTIALNPMGIHAEMSLRSEPQRDENKNFLGRAWTHIRKETTSIGQGIKGGVQKTIKLIAEAKNDSSTIVNLLKMAGYIFAGISFKGGASTSLAAASEMADTVQIFADVDYFVNQKYKEKGETAFTIAGTFSILAAEVGGVALWLGQLGVINLAKISESIGRIPVIGVVSKVALGSIAKGFAVVGFTFLGADAVYKMTKSQTGVQRRQSILDLARSVAEVAFGVAILAGAFTGVAGIVAFAVCGVITAGIGVVRYLHKFNYEEELKIPVPGTTA